ncbi:MAG: endonuclease/exonuclease/phosphatase family protein [Candidatus Latescibacteria bacterium]|nr:endonuclease/exonuclease/phosphatase family protein [Candidatus Latescibacterota bacterium]
MTFNIRYNNPDDGENAWPNRKDFVSDVIRYHRADLVGIQEALSGQVDDLKKRLPEFSWFGVGRDDGKSAGEFMAIFYLKDRLELLDSSTFWLSETPNKPGMGWDAACNRVVTWGKFRDKDTGKVFFHFNTHFDHMGKTARRESAYLLISQVTEIAGDTPAVITGDFNAQPSSEPYKIITSSGNKSDILIDSITVSRYPHYGPSGTWTGFENTGKIGDAPIDYIFVKNSVDVLLHETISDSIAGRFPSDHMPVLVEIIIE